MTHLDHIASCIKERPAAQRGVDLRKDPRRAKPPTDDERRILFNQKIEQSGA